MATPHWYVTCDGGYHSINFPSLQAAQDHAKWADSNRHHCTHTHHAIGVNVATSLDRPAKDNAMPTRQQEKLAEFWNQVKHSFHRFVEYANSERFNIEANTGEDEYRAFRDLIDEVESYGEQMDEAIEGLELDVNNATITVSAYVTASWDATNSCWSDFEIETQDIIGLESPKGGDLSGTTAGDHLAEEFHQLSLSVDS